MVSSKNEGEKRPSRRRSPATTPEAQENRMINLAVGLAEKQLREGTASAQVVVHYLKLAGSRNRLEEEELANKNALLRSRVQQIESQQNTERMYSDALNAMRRYQGQEVEDDDF